MRGNANAEPVRGPLPRCSKYRRGAVTRFHDVMVGQRSIDLPSEWTFKKTTDIGAKPLGEGVGHQRAGHAVATDPGGLDTDDVGGLVLHNVVEVTAMAHSFVNADRHIDVRSE